MDHAAFTPWASLAGGALIGLSATLLLALNGRVAGISGIYGGALSAGSRSRSWRWAFVGGLFAGGALALLAAPQLFVLETDRAPWVIATAGVLVGLGTRLGNGCTSGHGVCGVSRFSRRSIAATVTFLATGALTVWLSRLAWST